MCVSDPGKPYRGFKKLDLVLFCIRLNIKRKTGPPGVSVCSMKRFVVLDHS